MRRSQLRHVFFSAKTVQMDAGADIVLAWESEQLMRLFELFEGCMQLTIAMENVDNPPKMLRSP